MNQIKIIFLSFFILSSGAQAMHLHHYVTIHDAAQVGDLQSVQVFLDGGMLVDLVDEYGATALMVAAKEGHVSVMQLLHLYGASINHKNNYDSTALMLAAQKGHEDAVRFLITNGASINYINFLDESSLIWSAENGCVPVMRLLLAHGALINHVNCANETALIIAAKKGLEQAVDFLIAHNASVNHTNDEGETALMQAASNNHIPCCISLIDRMLKIPCDAQRLKIYTFLMCMKRYNLDRNIRHYIKPYLLIAIEEENKEKPIDSVALREIQKIKDANQKKMFIASYWPHYKLNNSICILQ